MVIEAVTAGGSLSVFSKMDVFLIIFVIVVQCEATEDFDELHAFHFAEINPIEQNISITISMDELPQFLLKTDFDFKPIDGSVNFIPLMSPKFYQRRFYLTTEGEKGSPPMVNHKKFFQLKYYNQYFEKDVVYRLTTTAIRPLYEGKYGLQKRDYTNPITKKGDVYFFTNLYPYSVHQMIPNTSNKRIQQILYMIKYQTEDTGYKTITAASKFDNQYQINDASTEEVLLVIVKNSVSVRSDSYYIYAQSDLKGKFPAINMDFAYKGMYKYNDNKTFLGMSYPGSQLKLVVLPVLNIKPLVMGREMCVFDQDIISTQPEKYDHYLIMCLQHQHFVRNLRSFSVQLFFIDEGLRGLYSTMFLQNFDELLNDNILAVLRKEHVPGAGFRLMDYYYDMKESSRIYHSKKSVAFISLLRAACLNKDKFDEMTREFFNDGIDYTLENVVRILRGMRNDFNFASDFQIGSVFQTWMNSTGYPLLYIMRESEHLFVEPKVTNKDNTTLIWFPFKLDVRGKHNYTKLFWMNTQRQYTIELDDADCYYLINSGHEAMLRVNYDVENWQKLIDNFSDLFVIDKGALVSDAYFFFTKKELKLKYVFDLLRRFKEEVSPVAWKGIEYVIIDLDRKLRFSPLHSQFRGFLNSISKLFYESVDAHNCGLAVTIACMAGNRQCLAESRRKAMLYMTTGEEIANRDQVLCAGMRQMDDDYYDYLIHTATHPARSKSIVLLAMSCNEKPMKISTFMVWVLENKEQEIPTPLKLKLMLNAFMGSDNGAMRFWHHFRFDNELVFKTFNRKQFHKLAFMFSRYLKSKSHYRSMRYILDIYKFPIKRIMENIHDNQLFIEMHQRELLEVMM